MYILSSIVLAMAPLYIHKRLNYLTEQLIPPCLPPSMPHFLPPLPSSFPFLAGLVPFGKGMFGVYDLQEVKGALFSFF